jgi:hypothetical protein
MLLFLYWSDSGCIRLYQHDSALFQVYQVVSGFIRRYQVVQENLDFATTSCASFSLCGRSLRARYKSKRLSEHGVCVKINT